MSFLTENQASVLQAVIAEPGRSLHQLSTITGLRQTAVARVVTALTGRGLVEVDARRRVKIAEPSNQQAKESPMGEATEAVETCPDCGNEELFAATATGADGTFYAECPCGWEGRATRPATAPAPVASEKPLRRASRDELAGATLGAWASSLTDERIAADLQRLAKDIRFHTGTERAALLNEAARRLGGAR